MIRATGRRDSEIIPLSYHDRLASYLSDINPIELSTRAGNGLKLVLYDEEDEYIEIDGADDLGIKFQPHHFTEPPFMKEMGYGLAPGFHYLIALKEREVSYCPPSHYALGYSECEIE